MKKIIIILTLITSNLSFSAQNERPNDTELINRLYTKLKKIYPWASYSQLLPTITSKMNSKKDADILNDYNKDQYKLSFENNDSN